MFLEHVNLTVSDLERSAKFYRELFGYRTRWRGKTAQGQPAVHVGNDHHYIALFQAERPGKFERDYGDVGMNHLGLIVHDLGDMKSRLQRLGVDPHHEADYEPGQRLYFFDPDGIEVELVQYDD